MNFGPPSRLAIKDHIYNFCTTSSSKKITGSGDSRTVGLDFSARLSVLFAERFG